MMQQPPQATATGFKLGAATKVDGLLEDLSVGCNVWGCNAQKQIFRRDGNNWTQIPGGLEKISAADDGTVIGVNSECSIFSFVNGNWVQLPGGLVDVSVGSKDHIIGVNKEGQCWRLVNGNWAGIQSSVPLKDISVGSDGTCYGVAQTGQVMHLVGDQFQIITGGLACVSVLDANNIVGCNNEGQVWRLTPPGQWTAIGGLPPISRVSFGSSGLWLTATGSGEIFSMPLNMQLQFSTPIPVAGLLTDISSGGNVTYGVNAEHNIFKFDGNQGWIQVPGGLKCISVAEDNTVVGCNPNSNVFQLGADGATWTQLPGGVRDVSIGNSNLIVGVNVENQVWKFSNGNWTQIACPHQLLDLSVGTDGTLYGVTSQHQVVQYDEASQQWITLPGGLVSISVSDKYNVIGVNAEGGVWQWNCTTKAWTQVANAPANVARVSVGTNGLWLTCKDQTIHRMPTI